jgi:uncharacterized protein YjbJ (UPF0337 family)
MSDDIFKGKWKQLRGQIQQKWGDLTNDDLDRIQEPRPSLKGSYRNATAIPRNAPARKSTIF